MIFVAACVSSRLAQCGGENHEVENAKMDWVNPHGWIYIDVKGPDGKVVNWAIEAGAPNALLRRGLRKTDFPIGGEVIVEGYQATNGSPTANGATVKFTDGRNFFLGASDTAAPERR